MCSPRFWKKRERERRAVERRIIVAERLEQKKLERAKKQQHEKTRSDAGKVLAKITALHLQFEADIANALFKQVPKVMKTKVEQQAKSVKIMKAEAESCLASLEPAPLSFTLQDTNELNKTCVDVLSDLASQYEGIKRCSRA